MVWADNNQNNADDGISQAAVRSIRTCSLLAITGILLWSSIEIIGWMFDIEAIKRPELFAGQPQVQPGAAVSFFLASLAVLLIEIRPEVVALGWIGRLLGVIVMLGGSAAFLEHTYQGDWGLDFQLWQPANGAKPLTFPDPMDPSVSLFFIFYGAALMFLDYAKKWRLLIWQPITLLVLAPHVVIIISHVFGQGHFCNVWFGCVKFSAISAVAFSVLALALLFIQPKYGLTHVFATRTLVGDLSRRVFGFALCTFPTIWCLQALVVPRLKVSPELGNICEPGFIYVSSVLIAAVLFFGSISNVVVLRLKAIEEKKVQTEAENARLASEKARIEAEKALVEQEKAREIARAEAEKSELQAQITRNDNASKQQLKRVCLQCAREFKDRTLECCPDDGSVLTDIADNEIRSGTLFYDRYEIVKLLGTGGISSVYLSKHLLMNKLVALKLLHSHMASDAKSVKRFQREAQALSKLDHPNIVRVNDFGISREGRAFIVMDYLDGRSLQEHIDMRLRVPWSEAVPLFLQICDGLQHAHDNGIFHRDLKPSNVMLMVEGENELIVKIVDFGMAKGGNTNRSLVDLTRTGEVFGTPPYMSPEQCSGLPMDARSDVYAFGCLMHETVVGRPPFLGEQVMDTLKQHLMDTPEPFAEEANVPNWLEAAILKTLAKHPLDRQQSVAELAEELRAGLRQPSARV